jgi:lysozyme family protein
MKANFEEAITFTFAAEGYKSNIPGDAGGATIYGIASHFWPADYVRIKDMSPDDAKAYAEEFYHRNFWDFIHADDLSYPLDCVAFDCAVNPGPTWCRKVLNTGIKDWDSLLVLRDLHYKAEADPNVLKGLLNRSEALRQKYRVKP